MSIEKRYPKNKPTCKVTFKIAEEIGNSVDSAHLVGEFNDWSQTAHPMQRSKNGAFKLTLDLEKDRAYQFRYLLGDNHWVSDDGADNQSPTPYGDGTNSILIV